MQSRSITESITIADQPSAEDLSALPGEGYVAVVNLRQAGEPEQPLSPEAEGQLVRSLGLDYLHVPIGGGRPLGEQGADAVARFLDDHPDGRVLVHCRKGARAAALVLVREARARGWGAQEAIVKGREMGLFVDGGLLALVVHELSSPPSGS